MPVSSWYKNTEWAGWARGTAMNPDDTIDTGSISVPVPTPLGFVTISIPKSCYYHYYNPSLHFGGAPGKCASYAAQAKTYYKNKDYKNAFETFGIASHYISDVAQPMHSGGELGSLKDYLLNWNGNYYHYQYEQYVVNNWDNGCKYSQYANNNAGIKSITDPSQAVKDMAAFSKPHSTTLWDEIYANPDNFDTSNTQYIMAKVLLEAAKYNAGLAKYIST